MFLKAVEGCSWMKTQKVYDYCEHSYFTFSIVYNGIIPWKEFYNRYLEMGGDGFYGCWKPPYLEPSLRGKTLMVENILRFVSSSRRISEKKIMAFKTNYKSLDLAQQNFPYLVIS